MKKKNSNDLKNKILITDKHVRWDWGPSTDSIDMVRYFFVISGERRDREKNFESILESLQYYGSPIDIIREDFGKVIGTKFNYNLKILDSRAGPNIIKWDTLSIPNVQDNNFYERIKKGFSIENYVANLYGKK